MFIDKFGCCWLLILGNFGNMVIFIVVMVLLVKFFFDGENSNKFVGWGFIVMIWIYNFSFFSICGLLSWIIFSEIFDIKICVKGVVIVMMVFFVFNIMIG